MSLDRCLFLARTAREDGRAELERRIERLAAFHGGTASWRFVGRLAAAGAVRPDGAEETLDAPLAFGEPLPPALAGVEALLDASAGELRALEGTVAALAVGGERACIAAGACAPGTLYAATSGPIDAWSTHAVAASWLALGRARVDSAALPEQLAAEFVGGERCLVEGVRALPQAVRIAVTDDGAELLDFWPLGERWRAVDEDAAAAHVEEHLLRTLERRAGAAGEPYASLTAGLDSRVVAVALRELGLRPCTFAWGQPGDGDVRGGADVAAALGLDHTAVEYEWLGDDEALDAARREARWSEGAVHVGFARLAWPEGMPAFVTGAGGELGRAFYYRDRAPDGEDASGEELAGALARLLEPRIAGARREARDALAGSARSWVDAALAAGHSGWRALDVVYGEQRLRRWLRGMLPRLSAPMVPAFATPEVARGLVSLPLADRLSDGFHRGFLESRAPDLAPPAEPSRAGRPGGLRRAAGRLPGLGRMRRAEPSALAGRWDERARFREWVVDGVLASPLVVEPLGERWARRTRDRFLAGDAQAEAHALAAAAPVALAEELRRLERDG
ncbi:MAG TPA: hypothetical protein VF520_09165 [Thermoleophilaceae bacterium]